MNLQTTKDIIACLPTGHTPFFYGKDDYALYLLSEQIRARKGMARVSDLKNSLLAPLLHKPLIKEILAKTDKLTPSILDAHLHGRNPLNLSLTLDTWGCDCDSYDSVSYTHLRAHET